nr:MAG TPA: Major capsid protein [Caudoviricetes sp.]
MAVTNFIPQIWEARLLEHLDKALVYGGLVNRDYEGDITQQGDTVKINQIGDITVKDYDKSTGIMVEDLDSTQTTLTIDQRKYFAFTVDDLDAVQANIQLVDSAMQRASYGLRDAVDQYIAGLYAGAGTTADLGTDETPLAITSATKAYESLVDIKTALDGANVPSDNRFVVVPPAFYGYLLKDSRFVSAGTQKTDQVLQTGYIGDAAGFHIYQSNNVPNTEGAKYKVLAGTRAAITFAQQLLRTEAMRSEAKFADVVRGELVFGAKVVQPKALACMTANFK